MKILRQTIKSILVILIVFALIINTQIKTVFSSNSRTPINVGVIFFTLDNNAMQQIKQELENLQKENKIKVSIFDAKSNVSLQGEILDSLLTSKPDLILSLPVDIKEDAVRYFIEKVKHTNIPLIMFNVQPEVVKKVSKEYDKVAFTASDSKKEGEMQGEIIRDSWNNHSIIDKNGDGILQYVLLRGPSGDLIANQRTEGVTSTINNSGIKTEQIKLLFTNWTKEVAKNYIENIFLTYSTKIDAVITTSDDLAAGSIEALQKYGYNIGDNSKFIPVFGINGSPEAKQLIDKGLMSGTVVLDFKKITQEFYDIGMDLINNVNPLKDANFKSEDGIIIIDANANKYIKG
ncbi:MAG TPA: galactose ABC transporter substrate-binding protein [Clostridium sp.]